MTEATSIKIPNFSLTKEIGQGGMARVWLAQQLEPKRTVAIKIVSPGAASDPSFLATLKQEGDTVAQFSHENIVTIYSCGVIDNHYYLAMEILRGGDLASKIEQGIDEKDTLTICRQLASALEHAHQHHILHRDIKPENVLFHDNGKAVLVDFGIAKEANSTSNFTKMGCVVGTPHYMSPERVMGKFTDERSDIYALGVVFYEMLMGTKLYEHTDTYAISYAHVNEDIPELPEKFRQYQSFLNRLIEKNPDERFQSAAEVVAAIDALANNSSLYNRRTSDPGNGRTQTNKAPANRHLRWIVATTLSVTIAAASGFAYFSNKPVNTTVNNSVMDAEKALEMADKLRAASVFTRMGNYDDASVNYLAVLRDFDCHNTEARDRLKALDPEAYRQILESCQ